MRMPFGFIISEILRYSRQKRTQQKNAAGVMGAVTIAATTKKAVKVYPNRPGVTIIKTH